MTTPYPLAWPEGVPRSARREKSKFKAALYAALGNVETSLRLFGSDSGKAVSGAVLSSNCALGMSKPEDPGVAVWFMWEGEQRCIAVDRYLTPAENLQAIHHVLEARRTELRHAGIQMARAAFRGFIAALPAPDQELWWEVLGVGREAQMDAVQSAWRVKVRETPEDGRRRLNVARDQARAEKGEV